ncbi:T9SS type A sorting domain-containing protein [bacterium]|nr:T9SS type A sorting domain-containing protein [bacterium]
MKLTIASILFLPALLLAQDSLNMSLLRAFETYDPRATDVAVSDNYAYVANGIDGILVVDISDLDNPQNIGQVWLPTSCITLFIIDSNLYVNGLYGDFPNDEAGLYIFDLTDRETPELIMHYNQPTSNLLLVDSLLYASEMRNITIMETNDRMRPDTLSQIIFEDVFALSLHLSDTLLYVIDNNKLKCFNVVNPREPAILDSLDMQNDASFITTKDSLLITANRRNGISLVDISNPENLTMIHTIEVHNEVRDIQRLNEYFCMVVKRSEFDGYPDSLYVFEIDDNYDLSVITRKNFLEVQWSFDHDQRGDTLYVADKYLRIFDISDMENIRDLGSTEMPRMFFSTTIVDDIYFGLERQYMWSINLRDPELPQLQGKTYVNNRGWPYDPGFALDTDNEYLWMACSDRYLYKSEVLSEEPWFSIIDSIALYEGDQITRVIHIDRETDILYYAQDDEKLGVIDLRTYENNEVYDMGESISDISQYENMLFGVTRVGSIYIFILDDPMNPTYLATINHENERWASALVVDENSLYYNYNDGVAKYDITNPVEPRLIGNYTPPYFIATDELQMYGDYIVYNNLLTIDYTFIVDMTSDNPDDWQPVAWYEVPIHSFRTLETHGNLILAENYVFEVFEDINPVEENKEQITLPAEVSLFTWPNPFNENVQISFTLPTRTDVRLSLHNILGEEIAVIVPEAPYEAGSHQVFWSPRENNPIASGIYFINLETSESVLQKKILYLR